MRTLPLLGLLLVATSAHAVDGMLEINQACATGNGCFPGDDSGFPVTLTTALQSSSFRLTSDLVLPNASTTGILISRIGASIDLNGHTILVTGCESGNDCTPASYSAVSGISSFVGTPGAQVRNGTVVGMGGEGVRLDDSSSVRNLTTRYNRGDGVVVGRHSRVEGVVAAYNGNSGIFLGRGSIASGCVASHNSLTGISTSTDVSVLDSTVRLNSGSGISTARNSIVARNTAIDNGEHGIFVFGGEGSVLDNTVAGSPTSTGSGIECGDQCMIRGNNVSGAAADGIKAGVDTHGVGNRVSGSGGRGIQVSTSSLVVENASSSNAADGIFTGNASTIRHNTVNSNGGDGIEAGDGSNVNGNTARSNAGFGLDAESTLVGFSGNVFGNNNGGAANPQTSSGRDLGGNQCDSVASCP